MPAETHCLSISELNQLLNLTLESQVGTVSFEGEISELTLAGSGHLYLTLKDAMSEIRAVLWASTVRQLKFKPVCGLAVRCLGRANVYQKNGRLQMIVQRMEPSGEGLLQKKYLELKAKLEAEGLFAQERKRALPFLPKAIGIVTSADGAAVHDIMVRLKERAPQIPTYLVDVRVQGPGSAEGIASALNFLGASGLVEVIICGRGGGSLEDLWAFNEEVLVRAVFRCKVPVISAIGHEVDISLTDLAADLRAPTPTAAAEMVAPRRDDLLEEIAHLEERLTDTDRWFAPLSQELDELGNRLANKIGRLFEESRFHLLAAEAKLRWLEPHKLLELMDAKCEDLLKRLAHQSSKCVNEALVKLQRLSARLDGCSPRFAIALWNEKLAHRRSRLEQIVHQRVRESAGELQGLAARLESASPASVLKRGYAMVEVDGKLVRTAASLKQDDAMKVNFADGSVRAKVTEKV